ncbi:putative integumentary mucin C.1-like [Scophthalmus maximus]|uniref:Putative integumentary mucin C.1-like n=1 Tax=Scophthalmus maximus TaxID=52904 RepID=A0A2U9C328_SCOMX|nr:putative integumentary mucin C.1-like [Scophthalmus maximus]
MKLLLSLTLIWALSSTGAALVCQTCTTSACTATVPMTCSSETMCITASIQETSGGTPVQQIFKACASSSLCPAISSEAFSVNLGVSSGLASAACCNTDNCNSANVPYPGDPDVNTLLCYSCDPLTSQCTSLLQCKGAEDRCIKASVTNGSTTTPAFGCATNNMCEAAASSGQLPFFESVGNVTGAACCTDSLCNTLTPTTTTSAASDTCRIRLTMIHLLIGLLVFTLY